MVSKRYSKYVLFRIVCGGVYSVNWPENENDSEEEKALKISKIKARNALFAKQLVKRLLKKNSEGKYELLSEKVLSMKDTASILMLAIMSLN
jgi:hypothetical protein